MPFIGNQPAEAYSSFQKQDFTTSATTSYTLDHPVANGNEIALFINFVRQEPTAAYTASGTSLTLTSATTSSDDMYCVFLGKAVQTVNPPSGSVGASQLASDAVTTAKINNDAVTSAKADFFNADTSAADLGNGLHIKTGDTGATSVSGNADELIVENTGNVGITLQSANDGTGNLYFGDVANGSVGRVSYSHSDNALSMNTNGSTRMTINSSGKALFNTTVSDHGMVASSGTDTSGNNACYGLIRSGYRSSIGISSTGSMTLKTQDAEIRVEDSAGNNTVVSPHNFDVIPNGASEDLAWSYYSRKGDEENDFDNTRYISTDITKVIRKVENLTGDKLIYSGTGNTDDGSTVSQNIIQSLIDRIETLEAKVTALENA